MRNWSASASGRSDLTSTDEIEHEWHEGTVTARRKRRKNSTCNMHLFHHHQDIWTGSSSHHALHILLHHSHHHHLIQTAPIPPLSWFVSASAVQHPQRQVGRSVVHPVVSSRNKNIEYKASKFPHHRELDHQHNQDKTHICIRRIYHYSRIVLDDEPDLALALLLSHSSIANWRM